MTITVASIFSGCGGLDFGFAKHGAEFVFANDFNKNACDSYKNNFSKLFNMDISHLVSGDIKMHWKTMPKDVDLLIGGFPCQSWSLMGNRKGFDDERGKLFYTTFDIIKEKQPKFFILENVSGLLSHDEGRSLELILKLLRSCGYQVIYKLIDFSDYDVPQARKRVIFWGKREDQKTNLESLIPIKSFNSKIRVRELFKSIDKVSVGLSQHQGTKDRYRAYAQLLLPGENLAELSDDTLMNRFILKFNTNPPNDYLLKKPKGRRPAYKLDHLKIAPTMVFNGGTIIPWHPWHDREITVREAAIIQSFPLCFEFSGNLKAQYHQIANAVSPRFSEHLALAFFNNFKK